MPDFTENVPDCGVCGERTREGDFLPSGSRNPRTGETPLANFVCRRCQRELRETRLVGAALDRHAKRTFA